MKKLILISLFLGLFVSQLFAGTTGTVADENGRLYNTAYFDVTLKSQGAMLDYITYSKRASFDVKQFLGTVNKIKEKSIMAKIHGRVEIPNNINTPQVYINVGTNYINNEYSWDRRLYYNNSKNFQNAEYFLVDVKKDKFGNNYIDYKMTIEMARPYEVKANWKSVPTNIVFSIAPKTRGFKNKFVPAKIYVFEE